VRRRKKKIAAMSSTNAITAKPISAGDIPRRGYFVVAIATFSDFDAEELG
jgi:hypothetical protein